MTICISARKSPWTDNSHVNTGVLDWFSLPFCFKGPRQCFRCHRPWPILAGRRVPSSSLTSLLPALAPPTHPGSNLSFSLWNLHLVLSLWSASGWVLQQEARCGSPRTLTFFLLFFFLPLTEIRMKYMLSPCYTPWDVYNPVFKSFYMHDLCGTLGPQRTACRNLFSLTWWAQPPLPSQLHFVSLLCDLPIYSSHSPPTDILIW